MIIFLSRKSIGGCWACSAEAALGDHSWGYRLYDDDDHDDNGEVGKDDDGDVHGDDGDNDDGAGAVQRQGVQLVAGVDQSRGRQVVPPCVCQVQLALARVRFPNPLAPGSNPDTCQLGNPTRSNHPQPRWQNNKKVFGIIAV